MPGDRETDTLSSCSDEKTAGAAEVMHFIVDAVTGCKFEVTDPASEEVVLLKILQVGIPCHSLKPSLKVFLKPIPFLIALPA
jgi:hypothetical protein